MKEIVTIIQARMGSSRLRGKVLMRVGGHPVLHWVVYRAQQAKLHGPIVVATSELPQDDPIADWCNESDISCFRGSEVDVLDRYYRCAREFGAEIIVRATADSPLLDPQVLDHTLEKQLDENADYVVVKGLPVGVAQECLSWEALQYCWRHGHSSEDREHVTHYILGNLGLFKALLLKPTPELYLPEWRLTLDTDRDFQLFSCLYQLSDGRITEMCTGEIVEFMRRHADVPVVAQAMR